MRDVDQMGGRSSALDRRWNAIDIVVVADTASVWVPAQMLLDNEQWERGG